LSKKIIQGQFQGLPVKAKVKAKAFAFTDKASALAFKANAKKTVLGLVKAKAKD